MDDDLNKNELVSDGLNRYRLEWPLAWATDSEGDYAASILPKVHHFEHIGEYQICLRNTWGSLSSADVTGEVALVGFQSCEALLCVPGDREYCSQQGRPAFIW